MESFPDEIRLFLQGFISSVEQLEILRLLGEDPDREWSGEEIGAQAQVPLTLIPLQLQELQQRGLLRCRTSDTRMFCQYGPHSADLEDKVKRLLELYRQRPVTMIRMVYERPAGSLRDFADAFRLKGKER